MVVHPHPARLLKRDIVQQHLTVTYLDETGIKVEVDIDVAGFTLENSPGGGSIKWRSQGAGTAQPAGSGGAGGFLGKLVSDRLAAATRPAPRERPRRPRPAVTAPAAADQPDTNSPPAEVVTDSDDTTPPQQA